jgi:hypothetical protein
MGYKGAFTRHLAQEVGVNVGMFTSFVLDLGLYGSMFVFPVFCQSLLEFQNATCRAIDLIPLLKVPT